MCKSIPKVIVLEGKQTYIFKFLYCKILILRGKHPQNDSVTQYIKFNNNLWSYLKFQKVLKSNNNVDDNIF